MRIVVNAVPVRGTSLGVVTENLLRGWVQLDEGDDLHVVLRPNADLDVPAGAGISLHPTPGSRFAVMDVRVPSLCRRLRADAMLGVTPATTMAPLPCPRTIIALDLRHENRPAQFSTKARFLRTSSYAVGYRQADAIVCISNRTRDDLIAAHPYLGRHRVTVGLLGADHVLAWSPGQTGPGPGYALAFGQWGNKNVDLVIQAWALLRARRDTLPLVIVGLPAEGRATVEADVAARGLQDVVTAMPWLDKQAFQRLFASASLVVFPSDYEGFGLPAVEAMRLGIPTVITPDRALLEVTGGFATVMEGWGAEALAAAVPAAMNSSSDRLSAAEEHAAGFTWQRTARAVRDAIVSTTL